MPRFTKLHIDALPAHAKAFFVWNDQMKGFGARVYPSRPSAASRTAASSILKGSGSLAACRAMKPAR